MEQQHCHALIRPVIGDAIVAALGALLELASMEKWPVFDYAAEIAQRDAARSVMLFALVVEWK